MNKKTVAIDVEAYEYDRWRVLEIGLVIRTVPSYRCLRLRGLGLREHPPRPSHEYHHLVIRENIHLRNGRFVPDNRDNYLFGDSKIVSLRDAARIVETICAQAYRVVFHAARNDLVWLDSIGVDTANLPAVVDTQDLARELNAPLGLERLGTYLGLTTSCLHNAGNDAVYTLKVYFMLEAMQERIEEERHQLEQKANRCPNCSSCDHSVPTTECLGIYFTDWGTMGTIGDNDYEVYLASM